MDLDQFYMTGHGLLDASSPYTLFWAGRQPSNHGRLLPILTSRHWKGPILCQREHRISAGIVPADQLRPNSSINVPGRVWCRHGVVDHIILGAVGAGREAGVTRGIHLRLGVLVKYTAVSMFAPGLILHGVVAHELEKAEAVERRIYTGGGVDDEGLVGLGVGQLLWALICSETGVWSTVRHSLPGFVRDRDDPPVGEVRVNNPRLRHVGNAEIGWPCRVLLLPAGVNVIQLAVVLEVCSINGELVKGVQHALHGEVSRPWIGSITGQDKHSVVDGRAIDRTHSILQGRRVVAVRRGREDDVPRPVDQMYLGSPNIGRPRLPAVRVRVEDHTRLGVVPVVCK